jgi:YVTN family beta-propeller protein
MTATDAAVDRMAGRLTVPFARGADRLALTLGPGPDAASAVVVPYDFAEHTARFGDVPDPRYVLTTRAELPTATVVTVSYELPGGPPPPKTVTLMLPAGTLAGTSVVVPLGADEGPGVRLRTLRLDPAPAAGAADALLGVTALLGNLARLLWAAGSERDALRAELARVKGQRRLGQALGPTLDLVGFDLGVPRFPPLPYAFEEDAVALYHLDETTPGAQLEDAMALYGRAGHPSVSMTAGLGATGRFGGGLAFDDPAAEVVIADHAELRATATTSFTAECFVKPDPGEWEGAVLAKHADPADPTRPGWALSVGGFGRGIPRSARFLVSDGPNAVTLFADRTLSTARFTHLAGVIDRTANEARLLLDGSVVAGASLAGVPGAPGSTTPVRIGRAGPGPATVFHGIVDEVRLSRAARTRFHPVLGEADESYRRRLRIFRRWTLPTPAGLQAALNDVAGPVHGVADPLVVDDTDASLVEGSHRLTVLPVGIAAGETIDDLGRRGVTEAAANGTAVADDGFDPALLLSVADPRAVFDPPPAHPGPGPGPDPRLLRVAARDALLRLLDILQGARGPGTLRVKGGFDPGAPGLQSVGRAVILRDGHVNVTPSRLAALAHRAGFTFVHLRGGEPYVYASVRSTASVAIEPDPAAGATATPEHGFDLLTGQTLALTVIPVPPPGSAVRWFTVGCGEGRATFAGRTDRSGAVLRATRPGRLTVGVELTRGARAFAAGAGFRVGIAQLAAGESISEAGALGVPESVADGPDDQFDPAYLVTLADPRLTFAPGVNSRRVQPALAARLGAMLDLLPGGGQPLVTAAWNPAGSGPDAAGRAVTIEPGTAAVPLARLGALAHAAGITYAANDGTRLRLVQAPGELVTIAGPDQLDEGASATLTISPRAAPGAITLAAGRLWTANTGTDTVTALDPETGAVTATVKVGIGPVAITARPDGSRVFTADRGGTVTAVDAATGTVAGTVDLGDTLVDLVHDPAAGRLWAAAGPSRRVAEIDSTTLAVTRSVTLADRPVAVAIQADGVRLWVATQGASVRPLDTATLTAGAAIAVAGTPADVAAGATRAYVTVATPPTLHIIDLASAAVQASFTDLGRAPGRLAVAPAGAVVYVTDALDARVDLRRADGTAHARPGLPPSVTVAGVPAAVTAGDHRAHVAAGGPAADNVSVLDADAGAALVAVRPLGTGRGERLVWSLRSGGGAGAQLASTTTPTVTITARAAGPLLVRAVQQGPDHTPPSTFTVGLAPALVALEAAGTRVVIRKDQYDLIMNVLNELHPVGVEVDTRTVRERVLELRDALLELFPPYTYPDFHGRAPRPATVVIGQDQQP